MHDGWGRGATPTEKEGVCEKDHTYKRLEEVILIQVRLVELDIN
jgi:hypothetical protein